MRIAFFTRCMPAHGLGGMEIHAQQVARGLAARGHDVVVYTTRLETGASDRTEAGVRIRHLAGTRPRSYVGGYWRVSRRAFLVDHAARPFDIVYSESSGAFGLLRDAVPILPAVVFLVGTPAADLRSKLRQGLHRPRIWAGIIWNAFGHLQSRRYLPRAVRILCESDGLRAWVLKELPLDPARVSVAWLGADTDRFRRQGPMLEEIRDLAVGRACIVFGGRFEREKGFDVAIQALGPILEERERVAAFMIGAGREKDRLLEMAAPLAVTGRFHRLAPIPHDRLPEMYRAATIYLMPTIRQEGSALSLVEAMACGCAIVASRIGGIPSVLRDGADAILVPPGDAGALRDAILRLLDDEEMRVGLGAEAERTARTRYSLGAMLDRIEEALVAAREGS
jgi:glycosyltransferase involved in cell wall biosynthesis